MQGEYPAGDGGGATPSGGRFPLRRLWPLALIAAGVAAFFALGLGDRLSLDTLARNRVELAALVAEAGPGAPVAFILVYTIVVALSLPGAAVMTIAGGFLFGPFWGTLWVVIGATAGATLLFLAARTSVGEPLRARAGPALSRMAEGFRADAFSYMLFLRLVPAFPFFLVNLAPAFLGVSLRTFVLATAIGIVPGSFVYANVGAGIGAVLDAGGTITLKGVLGPTTLTALVGLALLALLPAAARRWRARRGKSEGNA